MGELYVLASGNGKPKGLTEEEKKAITDTVNALPQSKESQIYGEVMNNPPTEREKGYMKPATVTYDATTETSRIDVHEDVQTDEKVSVVHVDLDHKDKDPLDEMLEGLEDVETPTVEFDVTADDVKSHRETTLGEMEISDATALELIKLINSHRRGDKIRFSQLPQQIADQLLDYMTDVLEVPVNDFSERSNRIRNEVADAIIQEFYKNIELDKVVEDYNNKIEHLYDDTVNDISPIFKQYNENSTNYFKKLVDESEDPEKKKLGEEILGAIDDAYSFKRVIDIIPRTRIKKFEVDKPNRVFDFIHGKYNDPYHHIYNLYGCAMTLARHLHNNKLIDDALEARNTAIKIMIVMCKVCQNYKSSYPPEHAFMYYSTYNIYLLDIYRGDQYNEYVEVFLKGTIMKVVEALRANNK